MDTKIGRTPSQPPLRSTRYIDDERRRGPRPSISSSSNQCSNTSNFCLLTLLVFFVGMIALAGVIISVFVWIETRDKQEPDTVIIDNRPPHGTRPPPGGSSSTTEDPEEPEPTQAPEEVCLTARSRTTCSSGTCSQKYRTFDGTCNNPNNPLWGASQTPFKRLLDPIYEDGIDEPVGWNPYLLYNGYRKPNARAVSIDIMASPTITQDVRFTDLVMMWGQFIALDTNHIPKTDSLCTESCQQQSPYCFPVFAPENDPRLEVGGCIAVTRSTRVCDFVPRRQLNSITSFMDASNIYGSTEDRALGLRDFSDDSGHLKVGIKVEAGGECQVSKNLLPFVKNFPQACAIPASEDSGIPCFFAGDVRANENIGLTSLHVIWVREHNRIADELKRINPQWTGETLYQEARKIVGALKQIISYEHWLPKIIGSKGIELLDEYEEYDRTVDPSTANSFATAYYRFGHGQISPKVSRLGPDFRETPDRGNIFLREATFAPHKIVAEGSVDEILRGLFGTPIKDMNTQSILSDEITEHLFELARSVPHDLAALNIQRGRDHGLPGYNAWRSYCSLPSANSFDDLDDEIQDANLRRRLQAHYGHPDNMDLFVAGLVEDPWYDSLMGQTFTHLLAKQFQRLRDGDRFWYANPGVFTTDQLYQLRQHSLARAFCDSGDDIQEVQNDVFKYVTTLTPNGYLPCNQIPGMDLGAWRDVSSSTGECTR